MFGHEALDRDDAAVLFQGVLDIDHARADDVDIVLHWHAIRSPETLENFRLAGIENTPGELAINLANSESVDVQLRDARVQVRDPFHIRRFMLHVVYLRHLVECFLDTRATDRLVGIERAR